MEEKEIMIRRIEKLLSTPPNHSAWSYQKAVSYKEACVKASQLIKRTRISLRQLVSSEETLRTFLIN